MEFRIAPIALSCSTICSMPVLAPLQNGFGNNSVQSRPGKIVAKLEPGRRAGTSSSFPHHDQILPFIYACDLAGADHGRAIELIEDGGARDGKPDVEAFALVDRAFDRLAVEAGVAFFPQCVGERRAGWVEARHLNRWHLPEPA